LRFPLNMPACRLAACCEPGEAEGSPPPRCGARATRNVCAAAAGVKKARPWRGQVADWGTLTSVPCAAVR
jgi:hypothetical protein